jgi:hypothetical protein
MEALANPILVENANAWWSIESIMSFFLTGQSKCPIAKKNIELSHAVTFGGTHN